MSNEKNPAEQLAQMLGTKLDCKMDLPDGSGCATMSLPLPKDHWLTKEGFNVPPMPFRTGANQKVMILIGDDALTAQRVFKALRLVAGGEVPKLMTKSEFDEALQEAAKYAVRASTMNGKEIGFDPDAMTRNFCNGVLGYWTETGLSSDEWANPKQ